MILECFYPKEWVESAYGIDWEKWYEKGMRGVIFDIDNTLVPHGAPANRQAKALFARLRQLGFHTFLLSIVHFFLHGHQRNQTENSRYNGKHRNYPCLRPAAKLEMMMNRSHLKNSFPPGLFKIRNLYHNR